MEKDARILIAEDDDGHYTLIQRNLLRTGIQNETYRFRDGQEVLDYLYKIRRGFDHSPKSYLLFLDLRMPKLGGMEVLEAVKKDDVLCRIPVIILTTASTKDEIDRCHEFGCSMYLVKPVEYSRFVEMIRTIGSFLSILQMPFLQLANVKVQ